MPLYCNKGHENPSHGRFCLQCGEKLEPLGNQGLYPGLVLGERYCIVRELGHGGFGRTYLAQDLNRFNEACVLKEFAPQVQGTYGLQKAAELFEREAGVLYKLKHPQIPQFRELFRFKHQDKGLLFLVQDYVDGQTYRTLVEARKQQGLRFNEVEAMQLLLQLLPVLEYIHSLGVIHRDISPDNLILRTTDGLPVLIDFGGVKQVAATVASQVLGVPSAPSAPVIATRLGKVGYAPHEQMQGGEVYPHSDLYALGVTVLVLLTGKEPPQLIDPHTLAWNWRHHVSLSPTLGRVLDKMVALRPGDRYQTASQVLQALTPTAPVAHPPSLPQHWSPPATVATVAVAPPPVTAPVNPPPSSSPSPTYAPKATGSSPGWGRKALVVSGAFILAGSIGWLAGNLWIQSQMRRQPSDPQPTTSPDDLVISPTEEPSSPTSSEISPEELRRKEALQQRRVALDIRYRFYADLVNEEFWTQYPEQRGRTLGTGSEDATLRAQWDAIASEQLRQLKQVGLSAGARRRLGSYGASDRDRWKAEANKLRVSSRSLYDMADAQFFRHYPQQKEQQFIDKPIGQVWQAIVADTLDTLISGAILEQITFDPGTISKQVSGTLQSGTGKVFLAQLGAGQQMSVNLSTAESALFSIYSPSGQSILLEDSRDRNWSGELPESGFYEFVVVPTRSAPINYQLEITVETPTSESPISIP